MNAARPPVHRVRIRMTRMEVRYTVQATVLASHKWVLETARDRVYLRREERLLRAKENRRKMAVAWKSSMNRTK